MSSSPARPRAARSDAQRNREAILAAATNCLLADPRASMSEIAAAAGVGRVTLYGHFASREDLVAEVFQAHIRQAGDAFDALAPETSATRQLSTLLGSSWQVIAESDGLIIAAEAALGAAAVREFHSSVLDRVQRIIRDGIDTGEFASTQSPDWLAECFFALLHGAARTARGGRMTDSEAGAELVTSARALVRARG